MTFDRPEIKDPGIARPPFLRYCKELIDYKKDTRLRLSLIKHHFRQLSERLPRFSHFFEGVFEQPFVLADYLVTLIWRPRIEWTLIRCTFCSRQHRGLLIFSPLPVATCCFFAERL